MNPVYRLEHPFWDINKLKTEAKEVKEYAHKIPYKYLGEPSGILLSLAIDHEKDYARIRNPYKSSGVEDIPMPALAKYRESFQEAYPIDWGDIDVGYEWIDDFLPWHVDKGRRLSGHPVQCVINVLLEGSAIPVQFKIDEQVKEYTYDAGLLKTTLEHQVDPKNEQRAMAKIRFKDKSFEEVIEGMESGKGRIFRHTN